MSVTARPFALRSTLPWLAFGLLMGLLLVFAFTYTQPYQMRGSEIQQAFTAPDFTLKDGQGGTFTLSGQAEKVVLIFFGYTSCPDVCPATLGEMKAVSERLGEQADQVRFVFITVDPARDTVERIGPYVSSFHPDFVGLTGTESELAPVWKDYGVYRAINPGQTAAGYLVDHSSRIYAVDRAGNLRLTYAFGTPVDDLVDDVRFLLKEQP